jgi:hypothetical protein
MFRLATVPQFAGRRFGKLAVVNRPAPRTAVAEQAARPTTADIRLRRFAESTVNEDTYTAILPSEGNSPIDLLRVITEAMKDLPEFQIQGEEDERFVLTLTLKA